MLVDRRFILIGLLVSVLSLQLMSPVFAYDWPMFHRTLDNTGYSPGKAPHDNYTHWIFTAGDGILSSPAVVDGMVFVGSRDNKFYCLGLSGVSSSGISPWYCFRGSAFHTGQMDSDSDYMDDQTEEHYLTDPTLADTDSDLLNDWDEIYYEETNPLDADTDDDGLLDGEEVTLGVDGFITNPLDSHGPVRSSETNKRVSQKTPPHMNSLPVSTEM